MPASQKTKKDQVVENIREAILSGEIESGERLHQEVLAQRFNTSSTPIREALRQLEAEGILEHIPYKGVQVAEVKLEDVKEIYMIRAALEALATQVAVPSLNGVYIQRLEDLQARMDEHIAKAEFHTLRKLNFEFHILIYQSAGMPQLLQIIKSLWTKFPWDTLHVLPGRAPKSAEEHRLIISAIRDENVKLAGQRIREHIEHGAVALADYMLGQNK